jgi:hypothetical protein
MTTTYSPTGRLSVKAVCTTGTELAPTLVTEGMSLEGVSGFVVHAQAAGAMTAGGKLLCHLWNTKTLRWNPCPDLNLTVVAAQYQSFVGFAVPAPVGRVSYVPSGVGVAVDVYITATLATQNGSVQV